MTDSQMCFSYRKTTPSAHLARAWGAFPPPIWTEPPGPALPGWIRAKGSLRRSLWTPIDQGAWGTSLPHPWNPNPWTSSLRLDQDQKGDVALPSGLPIDQGLGARPTLDPNPWTSALPGGLGPRNSRPWMRPRAVGKETIHVIEERKA